MFSFTKETLSKYIQNGKNNKVYDLIEAARLDEAWLNCFANGENIELFKNVFINKFATKNDEDRHLRTFLDEVAKIYTKPLLATNTGTVYASFAKIFETSDGKKLDFSFVENQEAFDYYDYRENAFYSNLEMNLGVDPNTFFQKVILNKFLYKPNTRLLINFLPNNDLAELPKPIIQLIDICNIEFIREFENGVEGLIFSFPKDGNVQSEYNDNRNKRYVAVDSQNYYEFEYNGNIENYIVKPHNFRFCPVKSLPLSNKYESNCLIKKSPIQDSFEDLMQVNILANQYNHDCLRVLSPTSFELVTSCEEIYDGVACEKGYHLVFDQEKGTSYKRRCPKCEQRQKDSMKFGKRKEIKLEDILNYQGSVNPMEIVQKGNSPIETDTKVLEYTEKRLASLLKQIENSIIGSGFNFSQSKESFNAYQIDASLDDKRNQLAMLSSKFEDLQEWCESGLADARYVTFIDVSISYGRQYFLQSDNEIIDQIAKYKAAGNDSILVKELKRGLIRNQYRNNPKMMEYAETLMAVLPYSDLSILEVIDRKDVLVKPNDLQSLIDYTIKLNEVTLTERYYSFYHEHIQNLKWGAEAKINSCQNWFYKEAMKIINNSKTQNLILENNGIKENNGVATDDGGVATDSGNGTVDGGVATAE